MKDQFQSKITDAARLRAGAIGSTLGVCSLFAQGLMDSGFLENASAKLQMLVVMTLALLAGAFAAMIKPSELRSKRLALGMGGRIGIRAGLFCALAAGGVLTFLATTGAWNAESSSAEYALKGRMWLVFWVSLAAILPSVLCGFLGGILGGWMMASRLPGKFSDVQDTNITWLFWSSFGLVLVAMLEPIPKPLVGGSGCGITMNAAAQQRSFGLAM